MVYSLEKLVEDFEILKTKVDRLENELRFLRENFRALGYLPEDSIASDEELTELERIDRLVQEDHLEEFEELK